MKRSPLIIQMPGEEVRPGTLVLSALALALVLWASAFVGIRAGLQAYSPGQLALLRFLIASTALLVYALIKRMRLPLLRDIPGLLLMGFVGITIYHVALNYGEQSVSAGAASILVATVPCFTALLATIFLRERMRRLGWLGVIISFLGVTIVVAGVSGGLHFTPAALLILLASLAESVYFVMQKPYLKKYTGFELTTYTIWAATLCMLLYAPGLVQHVRTARLDGTAAVVYLGIFPAAIAYVAWAYALSHMPASNTTSFLNIVPLLAALIAWLWLGEVPSLLSVLGGIIVIAGVLLVNVRNKE